MKITTLVPAIAISLLSSSFAAHAQYNFPLVELEKMTAKNASDFETVVMEKDYTLQSKLSSPVLKVYTSDKAAESGKKNTITRYQVPNAVSKIELSTTDKKYYLELKSKMAAMGFKFLGQEDKTIAGSPATIYNYTNGPFQLSLATYTAAGDINWFVVQIHSN